MWHKISIQNACSRDYNYRELFLGRTKKFQNYIFELNFVDLKKGGTKNVIAQVVERESNPMPKTMARTR